MTFNIYFLKVWPETTIHPSQPSRRIRIRCLTTITLLIMYIYININNKYIKYVAGRVVGGLADAL